jgi:hypothetical protein
VVGIAQLGIRDCSKRGAVVAHPGRAREQVRIGQAAQQPQRRTCLDQRRDRVEAGATRHPALDLPVARRRANTRAGALARLDVTVGDQVVVGADDDAARDAEFGREDPRGRQRRARYQPSAEDRVAKVLRELQRLATNRRLISRQQQVAGEAVRGPIGLPEDFPIGR